MRPRLDQSRSRPSEDSKDISRPHRLPHLNGSGGQVRIDGEYGKASPVVLHDHLLAVIGNPLVVVDPHNHAVRAGTHRVERLAPGVPTERLDVDSFVESFKDPRRLRFGGSGEAEHARDQSPADGGLVKFFGLILEKITVLRRQLPGNAVRGRFFLGERRCGKKT